MLATAVRPAKIEKENRQRDKYRDKHTNC